MSIDSEMTLVTALIKPQMAGRVICALHELPEFPGFCLTEVRGQGRGRGAGGSYKATEYDFYLRHLQVEIVCRSEAATGICRIIAEGAWTGRKGDGVIFTAGVRSMVRIREAGQRGEEANP